MLEKTKPLTTIKTGEVAQPAQKTKSPLLVLGGLGLLGFVLTSLGENESTTEPEGPLTHQELTVGNVHYHVSIHNDLGEFSRTIVIKTTVDNKTAIAKIVARKEAGNYVFTLPEERNQHLMYLYYAYLEDKAENCIMNTHLKGLLKKDKSEELAGAAELNTLLRTMLASHFNPFWMDKLSPPNSVVNNFEYTKKHTSNYEFTIIGRHALYSTIENDRLVIGIYNSDTRTPRTIRFDLAKSSLPGELAFSNSERAFGLYMDYPDKTSHTEIITHSLITKEDKEFDYFAIETGRLAEKVLIKYWETINAGNKNQS